MKTVQIVGDSKFGGASYLLIEWCRYLINKGVEVHALTTDQTTVDRMRKVEGLKIISDILIPREISPLVNLRGARALRQLLVHEKYDVLHTYSSTPGFIGRLVGKRARVPLVTHHQAGFPVSEFDGFLKRTLFGTLEGIAVNASTKSICVSHSVRAQAAQMNIGRADKYVTICNGIEIEPFKKAVAEMNRSEFCKEFGVDPSHVLIAVTGRLAAQKGLTYLLKAIPLLIKQSDQPFTIVLAGDGPLRNDLESEADQLGIKDSLKFLGFRSDIERIVAGCDLFCSPSLWEGLSISIMEAMAASRPIVTTSIAPNAELIEDGVTGYLVPPRDPELLADALARIMSDKQKAMSMATAAHKRVCESYNIQRMFDETWEFYNTMLS